MNVSDHLNQQKLQEILMNVYKKGNETENINIRDLIDDIKQQVVSTIHSSN